MGQVLQFKRREPEPKFIPFALLDRLLTVTAAELNRELGTFIEGVNETSKRGGNFTLIEIEALSRELARQQMQIHDVSNFHVRLIQREINNLTS